MKSTSRFTRIQKFKYFSQKEAELLSGYNRNQLRKYDDNQLVTPIRYPSLLYSWNQIIFLKILFTLADEWTFKQLDDVFKQAFLNYKNSEMFLQTIGESAGILLILENDDSIYLQILPDTKDYQTELSYKNFVSAIENVNHPEKMQENQCFDIVKYIAQDVLNTNSSSKISFKKRCFIIIPEIIRELTLLAKELEIENFDQKVG